MAPLLLSFLFVACCYSRTSERIYIDEPNGLAVSVEANDKSGVVFIWHVIYDMLEELYGWAGFSDCGQII
jgi:hypothetical protein